MTQNEFLEKRNLGLTFKEIGNLFNLSERQVNYRTKSWGLDFSKKKSLDENFFSSGTKASFYWAGFLAADGWIEGCRNRVGLALQKGDYDHLVKFKEAVKSTHDICPFMKGSAYRIRFNSQTMVEDLALNFNILPNKTHAYSLPLFNEDYQMLEFFRGYIEGDGHLEVTSSGRVALHLCSANKAFLLEYKEICEYFLKRSIMQAPSLQVNKKGEVYTIRFILDDSEELLNLLYKNSTEKTRLNRKFKSASLVIR